MAEKKKEDHSATLARVIGWYDDAVDATITARANAERDRDYYDNKQLTSAEIATLKERGQPPIVINRIKAKIDTMLGLENQTRTDPKAYPRTPQDESGAHAATDAIRFVCDRERFPAKRSEIFKDIIVEGTGGAIVEVKGEKREISIRRIPWDRLIYDAHSVERNFSDAKFLGIVAWADVDDAVPLYGKKVQELYETSVEAEAGDTHSDKPKHKVWADGKRKRIRLVELYYRSAGKWLHCVFNKAGFAVEPHDSDYHDENGEPTCPIEFQSCFVDRDNNRYGVVRQLIGPQDEINKRRSKALHLISARQFVYEAGAVDNVQTTKKELAKPDGGVRVNPGMRFEILDHNDMAEGNLGLLQEAKGEIDSVGANAALQGKDAGSTSGRQDQIKQQSAITEIAAVMDARSQLNQAIYRQVWARIKQFWTAETWVRVTDDEKNVQFVGLNTPAVDEMGMPVIGPDGQPVIQNNTATLDVDITLEDAPDTQTLMSEQFEQLASLAKAYGPQFMPIDLLIEASSLRNKDKILERLQGGGEQQQDPAQMQQQQMAMQAQQEMMGAEVEGKKAQAAQEAVKVRQEEAKVEQIRAQTQKTMIEAENERTDPLRQMLANQIKARQQAEQQPPDAA